MHSERLENINMLESYGTNEKTVFVLDHTQYFSLSSEDYIPIEFLKGSKVSSVSEATSSTNAGKFSKSLWTCSVEASIEYCRIVWDLFPRGKLVRFIVSDTAAHIVNTWALTTQNMSHVLNAMALVGVPPHTALSSTDYTVVHGLRAAVEALAEPTDQQANALKDEHTINEHVLHKTNRGRVICITSAQDHASVQSLQEGFKTVLEQQNELSKKQKNLLNIAHCHLVIINILPKAAESLVKNKQVSEVTKEFSYEVHNICAPDISNKLTHLIMEHYDLASTTVTGIPMKEEQNANSSANYDVEILHSRHAHTVICGSEALLPTSIKEGAQYQTVTLKWCTPRGCGGAEMQPCVAQHRVTPVDVTSRPSACLINFLLNGRSVLLEMPRKSSGKTTSHLLSARGGEIFIHALQITRSCIDDPPSIADGPGGRVSDYRIADFAAIMKTHRLIPLRNKLKPDENLQRARERLYRRSRYFPLTQSSSLVFNLCRNLQWLPYFLRKIAKEDMDKTDELQCQQYIFEFYTAASRGEPLPFPKMNLARLKGQRKTDQYKLFCTELDFITRSYMTTPHHKVILESVQNVRAACGGESSKNETDARDVSGRIIRATTDSPQSPPHSIDNNGGSNLLKNLNKRNVSNRSLLDIVLAAERSQSAKRIEFSGRLCTPAGQIAKLYPNFGTKEKDSKDDKEDTVINSLKIDVALRS